MHDKMNELKTEALAAMAQAPDETALRDQQVRFLGKKGLVTGLMKELPSLAPEARASFGKEVNELKQELEAAFEEAVRQRHHASLMKALETEGFDPTLPGLRQEMGAIHPLSKIQEEIEDVFVSMGFIVPDYPEAESEFFNFEAANIPDTHPARDMQDTFWLEGPGSYLLRTHTTPGQVRAMREFKPPFKAIFPGKVYRYEAVDASHEHTFHQVEGLLIDRDVSVANLIHSMKTLLREIFKRDMTIRLRPGYFPFVEPGFELDIRCTVCEGAGCPVCKHSGWVELLPCGLVHPAVIRHGGLDPEVWKGWAFGLGLSRLVMMRYGINDIRQILGGDLRFAAQLSRI